MEFNEILAKFPDARKTGDEYQTRCPNHNGKGDTSFSIKEGSGKTLLHCFGGCTTEQVVASVGLEMADLFGDNGKGRPAKTKRGSDSISAQWQQNRWGHNKPFHHHELGDPVKKYPYPDENGNLLYYICRFEPGLNGEKKAIRPCRPSGLKWGIGEIRRVLYRLPEIIDVKHVILSEGEHDADNLANLGFDSTAFAFGVGGFESGEYTQSLSGKTVYILFDADTAGKKNSKKVARCLKGVAGSVRILNIEDL